MRKRKTMMGMLLLVAVLMLGVGYAAISKTLTINGTATAEANDANFKLHFSNKELIDTSYDAGVEEDDKTYLNGTIAYDSTKMIATVTAGNFRVLGEVIYFEMDIVNDSEDLDAVLKEENGIVITNTGENAKYFEISVLDEDGNDPFTDTTIPAGEHKTFTLAVEYIKNYTGDTTASQTFSVAFNYDAKETETQE